MSRSQMPDPLFPATTKRGRKKKAGAAVVFIFMERLFLFSYQVIFPLLLVRFS
jgi:hypothetical protein